jgi:hypothetical protein
LNGWLGKESGKPVQAATREIDVVAELKREAAGSVQFREAHGNVEG